MKRGTRILSMALAGLLCLSLLPVSALAEEEAPEPVVIELPDIVEEETPLEEEAPAEEEEIPAVEESFVEEETPVEEESAAEEDPPAEEEPSAEEEPPVEEETPVTDGAATSGTCGENLTWTLQNGKLTITGSGAMTDYTFPNGLAPWNESRDSITSVSIPYGMTSIGNNAFYSCKNLETVSFATGCQITSIGKSAFQMCESLEEFYLPKKVMSIGTDAFSKCYKLSVVSMPSENPLSVGTAAFEFCYALKELSFGNDVSMGTHAFYCCYELESVIFAEDAQIGDYSFFSCSKLGSVTFSETGATTIGAGAFGKCAFSSVVLPAGVSSVGKEAFIDCTSMTEITVLNPTCTISDNGSTLGVAETAVIFGYTDSTAESYAETFEQEFVKLSVRIDETNFPDETFRNYVSNNFDQDKDGELSLEERAAVETISGLGRVASLEGIRYFTELKALYCSNRGLTSLDVSKNTKLERLSCDRNALTALDVSKNTGLVYLDCSSNDLTTLDVSANTALTTLNCNSNDLKTLNVSANTALTTLNCNGIGLKTLNVSANTALTTLNCNANDLTTLDVSANAALTTLSCGANDLATLNVSANTALTRLDCYGNDLTSLDVGANTALTRLDCSGNHLTSLDVSRNTRLVHLVCFGNAILRLDISGLNTLVGAVSGAVEGSVYAISFGYDIYGYGSTGLVSVDYATELVSNGAVLNQEFVDDGRISEDTILTAIDETAFPDDVFRSVVEAFDKDGDGRLSKGEANQVDSLSLSNRGISSVQGLEYFSRLSYLHLYQNNLTEVDLSGNLLMRRMLEDIGGIQEDKIEYADVWGVSFLCVDTGVVFHCYRQWQETKAATCTETGEKRAACDWCESVKTRSIPPVDHVWDDGAVTVKPTLANGGAGKILYSCANCTETKTEDIGCFAGDVNGDGDVNAADMVCLVRYILGGDLEVNPAAIDPTGDEKTNILDVVRLMRYLAGYDVAL